MLMACPFCGGKKSSWSPCSQPESFLSCCLEGTYFPKPNVELARIGWRSGSLTQHVSICKQIPLSGMESWRAAFGGDMVSICVKNSWSVKGEELGSTLKPLGNELLKLNDDENFLHGVGMLISSWSDSSVWTDDKGTSKQGEINRGLFAKNSTISEAAGRSLPSWFQQDFSKASLKKILINLKNF